MHATPRASRLTYHFEGAKPSEFFEQPRALARSSPSYRNPIALAQEWHRMLATGECSSGADLARKLGVSRARVTQVLGLLALAPDIVQALAALGDPLHKPMVTERSLRSILNLPIKEQTLALREIVGAEPSD